MKKECGAFVTQDPNKCTGCKACEIACFCAHSDLQGRTVGTVGIPVTPRLFVTECAEGCAPVQCKHCEDNPCLLACERDAIRRHEGKVLINTQKCSSCTSHACASACPFGAIRLTPLPSKCDLCIGNEDGPACVRACPHQALRYVDPEKEREAKSIRAAQALTYTY